jgi:hypothetical protein
MRVEACTFLSKNIMPDNKQTKTMEKLDHPNFTIASTNDGREKGQEHIT